MKTIFLSLTLILLFFWLTPGQNAALADTRQAEPDIPVPADLLGQLQASFQELAKGLSDARQAVIDMAGQRDEARAQVASLTQANDELRAEAGKLRDTLAATRQNLEQAKVENQQWQEKTRQLQARLDSGADAYDYLAGLRDQLKATAAEFSGLQADVAKVRDELEAPAERKALKQKVESLEQQNGELQTQLASVEDARAVDSERLQAAEQRLADRDQRNEALKTTVSALEERIASMERMQEHATYQLRERAEELKVDLAATKAELARVRKQQEAAQNQLTAMRRQAEASKATIDALSSDLAAFETTSQAPEPAAKTPAAPAAAAAPAAPEAPGAAAAAADAAPQAAEDKQLARSEK